MESKKKEETLDLRRLLAKYLRYWKWFVLSVAVAIGLGCYYMLTHTPKYKVSSTIMIRNEEDAGQIDDMLKLMGMGSSKSVEDEVRIIASRGIIRQAIVQTDVQTEYRKKRNLKWEGQYPEHDLTIVFPPMFTDTMRSKVQTSVDVREHDYKVKIAYRTTKETYVVTDLTEPIQTPIGPVQFQVSVLPKEGDNYRMLTKPIPVLVDMYQQQIAVEQVNRESNVISLSNTSDMPKRSIALIDKMVELYNLDAVIDKNLTAANTGRFIEERLAIITEELADVEQQVEQYKRENKMVNLSSEAQISLQGTNAYQRQLAEIETQISLIEYIKEYVENDSNRYSLIPANMGLSNDALVEQITAYNQLLLDRLKFVRSAKTENPVTAYKEEQLAIMRTAIIQSVNNLLDGMLITKRNVEKREKVYGDRVKSLPREEREFVYIQRQQLVKQELYLFLYKKREENALTLAATMMPAKTIDPAQQAVDKSGPRWSIALMVALLLGLLLPIGIINVWSLFQDVIDSKREYEAAVRPPLVAQIAKNSSGERIVVREGENTPAAELFRLLRTNINFMLGTKKEQHPVILVTSSVQGEGKSYVAINTALSFALLKKRVVLVGLDIRKPMLGEYLSLSSKGQLTLYLSDESYQLDDIILPSGVSEWVDVVPAGPIPPNPGELLLSQRLDQLISELKERYDYVILDTAPVGMVSDTFLLDRVADQTIYVSRLNYTPREMTDLINEVYDQKRLKNIACVLNAVPEARAGYGYGYGYSSKRKK